MFGQREAVISRHLHWGAALVGLLSITACAAEPGPLLRESQANGITVSVNGDRYQQLVIGEVITGAFVRSHRQAFLETESNAKIKPRISRVEEGRADLVVGCTGELLYYLDPTLAHELSHKYVADKEKGLDPNDGEWRDKVYQAMVGSLPNQLMATDPSNAQGCTNYDGPELPQNVVPVFRETALSRDDRVILNKVTGGLTTSDLEKLFAGPQDDRSTRDRADQLLASLSF